MILQTSSYTSFFLIFPASLQVDEHIQKKARKSDLDGTKYKKRGKSKEDDSGPVLIAIV